MAANPFNEKADGKQLLRASKVSAFHLNSMVFIIFLYIKTMLNSIIKVYHLINAASITAKYLY